MEAVGLPQREVQRLRSGSRILRLLGCVFLCSKGREKIIASLSNEKLRLGIQMR